MNLCIIQSDKSAVHGCRQGFLDPIDFLVQVVKKDVSKSPKDYFTNARILAPMVRVCNLPFRLLALKYGADIVYTPETVDRKIIGSQRVYNELLGTFDYIRDDRVFLRCHPSERNRLALQLGTADPEFALKAARIVAQDIAFIDVNCGCPKSFSISGGMGAALLSDPDRLCAILKTLVNSSGLPVTAKIRVLGDTNKTLALVDRIIKTGIVALAVHARTKEERPSDKADWDVLRAIGEHLNGRLPLIANGDIFGPSEVNNALKIKGVSAVMLARGPRSNFSVFGTLLLEQDEVVKEYVRYAIRCISGYKGIKYILPFMIKDVDSGKMRLLHSAHSTREIAAIWGLEKFYDDWALKCHDLTVGLPDEVKKSFLMPELM